MRKHANAVLCMQAQFLDTTSFPVCAYSRLRIWQMLKTYEGHQEHLSAIKEV